MPTVRQLLDQLEPLPPFGWRCAEHEKAAQALCTGCGKPLCGECRTGGAESGLCGPCAVGQRRAGVRRVATALLCRPSNLLMLVLGIVAAAHLGLAGADDPVPPGASLAGLSPRDLMERAEQYLARASRLGEFASHLEHAGQADAARARHEKAARCLAEVWRSLEGCGQRTVSGVFNDHDLRLLRAGVQLLRGQCAVRVGRREEALSLLAQAGRGSRGLLPRYACWLAGEQAQAVQQWAKAAEFYVESAREDAGMQDVLGLVVDRAQAPHPVASCLAWTEKAVGTFDPSEALYRAVAAYWRAGQRAMAREAMSQLAERDAAGPWTLKARQEFPQAEAGAAGRAAPGGNAPAYTPAAGTTAPAVEDDGSTIRVRPLEK